MHAIYENHYLTDNDVANFARQSFSGLASQFTNEQNNNLIKFLARGMAGNDWQKLITEFMCVKNMDEARALATYMRNIPEHWVPFAHPHISIRVCAPVPIRVQC